MHISMGTTKCISMMSLGLLTVLMYYSYLTMSFNTNQIKKLRENLKMVYSEIKLLDQNHRRLELKIKQFPGLLNGSTFDLYSLPGLQLKLLGPKVKYESLRRKIYSNTKELWYYVSHQLNALRVREKIVQRENVLKEIADRKRCLLSDHEKLPALDGYVEWRHREAALVGGLVQRRFYYLQNPRDCRTAKKLVCSLSMNGIGSCVHHVVHCLVTAYAFKRTLILAHIHNKRDKKYWANVINPLSRTCTDTYTRTMSVFQASRGNNDSLLYYLPQLTYFKGYTRPYFIPEDLSTRITRFNGDPYSWWIGQATKYILNLRRPDVLNATIAKINFGLPIVGVHICRTDKIIEAKYHDIDEYMIHVADYYEQLEQTRSVDQRRVYLATDDANVLKQAIARYPQYTFYGDYSRAESAALSSRNGIGGFTGILVDVHMLSMCDHVICTFSSNVGRLSYELMQTKRIDAYNRFTSLDNRYHFTGQEKRLRRAVMRNKNIALEIGDLIQYKCLNYSIKGTVLRTQHSGIIPIYKTEEHLIQYPYPRL